MFETHLPVASHSAGAEDAPRAFDWGELVARINAARDVHLMLRPGHARRARHASFAAQACSKHDVNLLASADGKGVTANWVLTANDAAIDHRGTR